MRREFRSMQEVQMRRPKLLFDKSVLKRWLTVHSFALFLGGRCLWGQSYSGKIAGLVADSSAGVLQQPSVTILNEGTPADSSVTTFTAARERMNLQFRSELFNLLNHPNFASPNVTVKSSGFGTIASTVDVANG